MSSLFTGQDLADAIKNHLDDCTIKIIEEEIISLQDKVGKRVREKTGEICANVLSYFDFRMDQNRLVISVDFKNIKGDECDKKN